MWRSIILVWFLFTGGQVSADESASPIDAFAGEWEGTGVFFDSDVVVSISWTSALGGSFSKLHIRYQSPGPDRQIFFEGIAYYRPGIDDTPSQLAGTWVDSQGNIHPLLAKVQDGVLRSNWGTESTELGRSTYRLIKDGDLEVIDSVKGDGDEFREFSRAIVSR